MNAADQDASACEKGLSRRRFLGAFGASVVGASEVAANAAGRSAAENKPANAPATPAPTGQAGVSDGPSSPLFSPIPLSGDTDLKSLERSDLSRILRDSVASAPVGDCTCWGIPFQVGRVALVRAKPVTLTWAAVRAPWLVFLHTTDVEPPPGNHKDKGFFTASPGAGRLNERVADYVFFYADQTEERVAIRRRHQGGWSRS